MNLTADLRNAIAMLDRLHPPTGGNVIDLERIRFQREIAATRKRLSEPEWEAFTGGLVSALARRMGAVRVCDRAGDDEWGDDDGQCGPEREAEDYGL